MSANTQSEEASLATTGETMKKAGHWVRVVVMFLSLGFIFPHAMTEDEDEAK